MEKKLDLTNIGKKKKNLSTIGILKDGRVLLWPAAGNRGMLFESKAEYDSIVKDDIIPLVDPGNIVEQNQALIKKIPNELDGIFYQLSEKLDFKLEFDNIDSLYLDEFAKRIKKFGYKKAYDELFIPLSIYVGELIMRNRKGEWQLRERFGVNPYLSASVYTRTERFNPFRTVMQILTEKKNIEYTVMALMMDIGIK
jgi:hypothetical protein